MNVQHKLAVQMYTVREYARTANEFAASLEKVAAIGYRAVQLSGIGAIEGAEPEVSIAETRRWLDSNGLKCIATHRSWEALAGETEREIDIHHELGCNFAAIGGLPRSYSSRGAAGYTDFVRDAAPIIARLKSAGIGFGYHNHDREFIRTGAGQATRYDIFIDEGGADFNLEIDVYWAIHAGVNPEALVRRCSGRVPVLHLKDKEVTSEQGPIIAAIGEGNMDWAGIIPACESGGTEWYAIEQDTCPRDPFDCLRSSYEFLASRDW